MRKFLLCFFILFFLADFIAVRASYLYAQESPAPPPSPAKHLYFTPMFGLLYGQGEEIVYMDNKTDDKLSQLLWNMSPLVYFGANLNYTWHKPTNKAGVFAELTFKGGIPMTTGKMEDSDWMDSRYHNFLTHYSVSDNYTDRALLLEANVGPSFSVRKKFMLKPFFSYNYMNFSWSARGGSFLYPPTLQNTAGHGYLASNEKVCSYEQTWHIISQGLTFSSAFNKYFNVDIMLKVGTAFCSSVDHHNLRSLKIDAIMLFGAYIEPKIVVTITPAQDRFSIILSVAYTDIIGTRGTSFYDYSDGVTADVKTSYQAGAGLNSVDVGLYARINLLPIR